MTDQRIANSIARKAGCGRATEVVYSPDAVSGYVLAYQEYGVARFNKAGVQTYWGRHQTSAYPNETYVRATCTVVLPVDL